MMTVPNMDIRRLLNCAIFLALICLTAHEFVLREKPVIPRVSVRDLFTDSTHDFLLPGIQFEPLKAFLPRNERTGFIVSHEAGQLLEADDAKKLYYDAANYFAPQVLSFNRLERINIIYCRNQSIADQFVKEMNLRWIKVLADGVGLAERNP